MKDHQPKSLRTLKSYVDKLGDLKSQIKKLEEEFAILRSEILKSDKDKIIGSHFRANIINYPCTMVSWKSIVEKSDVPQSLIDEHTKIQDRSRITLSIN